MGLARRTGGVAVIHDFPEDSDLLAQIEHLGRDLAHANEAYYRLLDKLDRTRSAVADLLALLYNEEQINF